jgi:hypothetical protein
MPIQRIEHGGGGLRRRRAILQQHNQAGYLAPPLTTRSRRVEFALPGGGADRDAGAGEINAVADGPADQHQRRRANGGWAPGAAVTKHDWLHLSVGQTVLGADVWEDVVYVSNIVWGTNIIWGTNVDTGGHAGLQHRLGHQHVGAPTSSGHACQRRWTATTSCGEATDSDNIVWGTLDGTTSMGHGLRKHRSPGTVTTSWGTATATTSVGHRRGDSIV